MRPRSRAGAALRVLRRLLVAAVPALLLFGLLVAPVAAADDTIYVVHNTTTIDQITNQTTGAVGAIPLVSGGTTTLLWSMSAAARSPFNGYVYYLSTNAATPLGRLAYWDPVTQQNVCVNDVGSGGNNIVRLGFDAAGVLYALGEQSRLFVVNTTVVGCPSAQSAFTLVGTGPVLVTNRGNATLPINGDLAFGPDGVLYLAGYCTGTNTGSCLYAVSTTPNSSGNPTAVERSSKITTDTSVNITSLDQISEPYRARRRRVAFGYAPACTREGVAHIGSRALPPAPDRGWWRAALTSRSRGAVERAPPDA